MDSIYVIDTLDLNTHYFNDFNLYNEQNRAFAYRATNQQLEQLICPIFYQKHQLCKLLFSFKHLNILTFKHSACFYV